LEGLRIGTDIAHKRAQLNVPKGTQKKGDWWIKRLKYCLNSTEISAAR
jgi:hypothetical protein